MSRARVLAAVIAAALSVGTMSVGAIGSAAAGPRPPTIRPAGFGVLNPALRARILTLDARLPAPTAVALAAPVPQMTVHDRVGDATFPQGDLTGAGVLQNSSGTGFGVTVKAAVNPLRDATWQSGATWVAWYLDTNRNGLYEYIAIATVNPNTGHFIAAVFNTASQAIVCVATPTFVPHVGYRLSVPAGCLPHLTSVRFGSCMAYFADLTNPSPPTDCAPDNDLSPVTVVQEAVHSNGYWMLGADGHVYPFGGAVGFPGLVPGATAMAPRKDGKGYWVVDLAGHVFAYGSAHFFGGAPALAAGEFVSTISATPNGNGYWLFTNQGRAFPFGNASSDGDMAGTPLNGPIVASVATPTGHGYYMVGSDGGIFSFGDAHFHGSTGGMRLNQPVVGISPTPDGHGYWLVATDGGVFAFGAPFRGSMGGTHLNQSVDGLVAYGNGYLMAASDGGVFDFSDRPFAGSLAANPPAAPIIGLAAFSS